MQPTSEISDSIVEPLIQSHHVLSPCIIPESSGLKSAPKKSFLSRTISQTDIENQKQE